MFCVIYPWKRHLRCDADIMFTIRIVILLVNRSLLWNGYHESRSGWTLSFSRIVNVSIKIWSNDHVLWSDHLYCKMVIEGWCTLWYGSHALEMLIFVYITQYKKVVNAHPGHIPDWSRYFYRGILWSRDFVKVYFIFILCDLWLYIRCILYFVKKRRKCIFYCSNYFALFYRSDFWWKCPWTRNTRESSFGNVSSCTVHVKSEQNRLSL